jgi:hypothetical protein
MTPAEWAGIAVSIITVIAGFSAAVRWLVKHYLYELKPNSGSSLKDSVTKLERQVEEIYRILISRNNP